jgi:hypothetical protein
LRQNNVILLQTTNISPMQSQVKKLAVICNVCFWLTIIFKYWKNARNIQTDVLNTILILGALAALANLAWLILSFAKRKNNLARREKMTVALSKFEVMVSIFNVGSLVAQLVYMYLFYL